MSRTPAKVTQADVARSADKTVVYLVRIGKHIKIGFSSNLPRRLKSFENSATSVDLLLSIPGGRELERRLHEALAESRAARELFHPEYRVTGFIDVFKYAGLERALEYLETSTPLARKRQAAAAQESRVVEARKSKAEKDAYFASLVAGRKQRLGW